MKGIVIEPNGTAYVKDIPTPERDLQEMIGGWLELTQPCHYLKTNYLMFFDAQGYKTDREINKLASLLIGGEPEISVAGTVVLLREMSFPKEGTHILKGLSEQEQNEVLTLLKNIKRDWQEE